MSSSKFPSVPAGYPFPRLEKEVLEAWRANDVFARTIEKTACSRAQLVLKSDKHL